MAVGLSVYELVDKTHKSHAERLDLIIPLTSVKVFKSNFFPILVSTSIRTGGCGRCGRGFTREGGEKVKDHLIVDFEVGDPKYQMC
jgi:hypothetical protein